MRLRVKGGVFYFFLFCFLKRQMLKEIQGQGDTKSFYI